MPNGLADIQVDVIVTDQPPEWGLNTRITCATCNRGKASQTVSERAEQLNYQRDWKRQQERIAANAHATLPLFADLEFEP